MPDWMSLPDWVVYLHLCVLYGAIGVLLSKVRRLERER